MARDLVHKAAYDADYIRSRDNIMIRPTKPEGARIRAAAAAAGLSVQRYILDTLRPHLPADDGFTMPPAADSTPATEEQPTI